MLLLAAILFVLSLYASVLDRELSRQVWTNLDNVAGQSTYNIREQCNIRMSQAEGMAAYLSAYDIRDRAQIQTVLEESARRYFFKRAGLALPDGSTYTTDGTDHNVRERDYFIQGMQGKTGISNQLIDYADGASTIVFSAPVYVYGQEEIQGVIFFAYDFEDFCGILRKSILQKELGFLILDGEGNTMVSDVVLSQGELTDIYHFMEAQGKESTIPGSRGILDTADENGAYMLQDEAFYMHFNPLQINDWYFVAVVSKSVVLATKNRIMLVTYGLCTLIVLLALLLICYTIHRERMKNRLMEKVLYEDSLTGGFSYQRFRAEVRKALAETDRKAAFIIMDIDQFKLINELFGVKSGDETLLYLNRLWMEWIQPPEVFARRSADCFGVLAFYDDEEALLGRIDAFVKSVLDYDCNVKGSYVLRPHLGIYPIQSREEDFESMQNNAAIIHGMLKGNNSVYYGIFDQRMKEKTVQNKMLEDQMEVAYRRLEYEIYYQPKYDAKTKRLCGAEALIRWRKASGELIEPGAFIHLAEKKGILEKLDYYVLEEVCRQLREWKAARKNVVPVSVNLSCENIKNEMLAKEYAAIRGKNALEAGDVEIELTESTFFENPEAAQRMLTELRSNGFRVLMDDYGMGHSSLMLFKYIPVDVVKLSKGFVDDYNNERGEEIIRCVIDMMRRLHMSVTAEGVETKEQYEFLRDLGCDTIQGYYFAKPMPAEEFSALLLRQEV